MFNTCLKSVVCAECVTREECVTRVERATRVERVTRVKELLTQVSVWNIESGSKERSLWYGPPDSYMTSTITSGLDYWVKSSKM